MKKKVGFVGIRGMVGSVLLERMIEENDFSRIDPTFYSSGSKGKSVRHFESTTVFQDPYDWDLLMSMNVILTCQGSEYTERVHPELRKRGWQGYWIDAASTLRMKPDSLIALDPINLKQIEQGLDEGIKDFVGGNCTVSLLLMALHGLIRENLVDWVSSMTYQAASGAGASAMEELLRQMQHIGQKSSSLLENPASSNILNVDKSINQCIKQSDFPRKAFGRPLACNLLPWIDEEMPSGQSREEWKGQVESQKILNMENAPLIDGLCVRVGSMRCHAQALTIKLRRDVSLRNVHELLATANDWVKFVPNTKEASLEELTPSKVSGSMFVPIGRMRKLSFGPTYLSAFTLGDQLLWGASEPLRRVLKIILSHI